MCEYLVVDERWELITTQSEPYMTVRSSVKQLCLTRIHTFQQLCRVTLVLEVDQIFVIFEYFDVCESTPTSLYSFSSDFLSSLLR